MIDSDDSRLSGDGFSEPVYFEHNILSHPWMRVKAVVEGDATQVVIHPLDRVPPTRPPTAVMVAPAVIAQAVRADGV